MLKPAFTYGQDYVGLSADQPVRVELRRRNEPMLVKPHDHEFHEITVITSGVMEHTTESGTEKLRAGTVIIMSPGAVHTYSGKVGLEFYNIYYLAEWFLADIRALRGIDSLLLLFFESRLYGQGTPPVVRLDLDGEEFARLRNEIADMGRRDRSLLYLESSFLKFVDELAQVYRRQYGMDFTHAIRPEVQRGLDIIEHTVATHGAFSAKEVARRVGLSLNRFGVLFHECTGQSPTDYYQKHRIHHVCRRLLGTQLSISEIAHEFGFADAAHLNRHFRTYQKVTPREYRMKFGVNENQQ